MSLYERSVTPFIKSLRQLRRWLDMADAHAQALSLDPNVLVAARLAPNQFALAGQVQTACDTAKLTSARLAGTTAPAHADTEQTLDELKARIESCVTYLETLSPSDFDGGESRAIPVVFAPGKVSDAADYLTEFGLPNFYFHLTTAYAILRHNGVPLTKPDFIGGIKLRDG